MTSMSPLSTYHGRRMSHHLPQVSHSGCDEGYIGHFGGSICEAVSSQR